MELPLTVTCTRQCVNAFVLRQYTITLFYRQNFFYENSKTRGQRHMAKAALNDPCTRHAAYTALAAADYPAQ